MTRKHLLLIGAVLLLASCSSGQKPAKVDRFLGRDVMQVPMPHDGEYVNPVHGKEEWFSMGPLAGQNKVNANGLTELHVFRDGNTIVTVNLNIHPVKGFAFVTWLQKEGAERVRVDTLQNPSGDVRYSTSKEMSKDLRDYNIVIVTREPLSGPSESDLIVAKGLLTERKR